MSSVNSEATIDVPVVDQSDLPPFLRADAAPPPPLTYKDDDYFLDDDTWLDLLQTRSEDWQPKSVVAAKESRLNFSQDTQSKLYDWALSAYLMYQDVRYRGSDGLAGVKEVPVFLDPLDMQIARLEGNSEFEGSVADWAQFSTMTEEMLELLQKPEVIDYLVKTKDHINRFDAMTDQPQNFWEWTLSFTDGDEKEALKWIAVLFQDSMASAHVNFVENLYPEFPRPVLQILRDLNVGMQGVTRSGAFQLYPENVISQDSHEAFYHFYVIAYLAQKNSEETQNASESARRAFLMDLMYEYYTKILPGEMQKNKAEAEAAMESEDWAFKLDQLRLQLKILTMGPGSIDREDYDVMLEVTYLAYAGAYWGVGLDSQIISYEDFVDSFAKAPADFVKSL